ncbi:hypothetical protein [Streptomyces hainanensis]|uniref:Protein kilB n=1 Tax=Streptomyces hainanensis TaxID=402648 RepID=A0A4R4TQ73_9ACTN|nr:hypothetical protein [Streptomyces hainanensis]TDC78114.1 hypothetical protein E1283_05810 [Streptomyces hainanensis]
MAGVLSALIAVLGTLLGVALTQRSQRQAAARDQAFATQQQLRSERMAVYSDFAGAVTELRRGQQDRWHRRYEDPEGSSHHEARIEAYRLRGVALHVLFRVQLIASGQPLIDAARQAYELTSATHKASDQTELSTLGGQAREALEHFVKLATADVR